MTLEQLVEQFLVDHPNPTISDCVEHILKKQDAGELDDSDRIWIETAQRRGLEQAVNARFRSLRFLHRGVSTKRFAAFMDTEGHHRWADLKQVLATGTPEEKKAIAAHAWSVIQEAMGM